MISAKATDTVSGVDTSVNPLGIEITAPSGQGSFTVTAKDYAGITVTRAVYFELK